MESDIINLLIVEDSPSQLQMYEDTINHFNRTSSIKIKQIICDTFEKGETALKSPFFDAAIIDLKLSSTDKLEGRQLIESVYKKIRIPIFIYSGMISQIDDIPENALLRKRVRTESLSDILDEILAIYKTGLTSFLRPNGIIDNKLSEIFWDNLSSDINIWIKKNNQTTLLRYIFSHFQEHLDINSDGDFHDYDPSEIYIKPPIKKNIHTGDIIEWYGRKYIILTPACDIVINDYKTTPDGSKYQSRRADKLTLVELKDFDINTYCRKNGAVDKGLIKEFVNNKSYRYHYLPPLNANDGFLIDFQEMLSLYCNAKFKRIASISSPFIKDIISRFSSYYSRQGQPTFGQKQIIESILKKISPAK